MQRIVVAWLGAWLVAERGRFVTWLPVFMGTGVVAYFSLRNEPAWWPGCGVAMLAAGSALLLRHQRPAHGIFLALTAVATGFTAAQIATARAPPMPAMPTHATIVTGVIRSVEPLPEGRRITLEPARLDGGSALQRWLRVRLRNSDLAELGTGDSISVRALVRPPAPPAYPGAWDLQRDAWFSGQAGSGYALGPVQVTGHAMPSGPSRIVQRLRETIARHIAAVVPGAAGAVATTLLTGGTTGIPPSDHDAFRASGLAHLLAVAGLHIGIVMGWALVVARVAFAASEYLSLRWQTKKLAAIAALAAGGCYMVLTGMHLPIVRSFAMATLYVVAVLAERRAISLRGLALAATVLMLIEPEQVPGVSFQMSFSAVLALIAGYEALRPVLRRLQGDNSWYRRAAMTVVVLALTSLLAGGASAPFGAYHFGRIQLYFIAANVVAVPLAALWAMPAGLLALLLMPLGLDAPAFVVMGWGTQAILVVARTTAAWPAATMNVPHIPSWGLAITAFGIAWLGLWRSKLRLIGVPVIALGLATPLVTRPADMLVSADARLIGLRIHDTVYLQQVSGASAFTRDSWLQYWAVGDGPRALPIEGEAANGGIVCKKEVCLLRPTEHVKAAMLVRGAMHPEGCDESSVIVSAEPARGLCQCPCPALVDRFTVWRYGATAIWLSPTRAVVRTDRWWRGKRPWVPPVPVGRSRHTPTTLPPAQKEAIAEGLEWRRF